MFWFSKTMALRCEVKHTHEISKRIHLLIAKNGLKWGRTSFLNKQIIHSDNRCINRATIHRYVNCSSLIRTLNSIWFIAWKKPKSSSRWGKEISAKECNYQTSTSWIISGAEISYLGIMNPEIDNVSSTGIERSVSFVIHKFYFVNWKDKEFILMTIS